MHWTIEMSSDNDRKPWKRALKSVKRKTGHQKKKPFFGGIRPHALGV
jgi:hypothetical protein